MTTAELAAVEDDPHTERGCRHAVPDIYSQDRYLSVHQAAAARGVSVATMRRDIKSGKVPFTRVSTRRIGIKAKHALAL
jgi:hypothetical protein